MFIDSHAHIYLEQFNEDLDEVIANCLELGVEDIYMPNIDTSSIDALHAVAERFDNCKPMMGLHPCSVKEDFKEQLKVVKDQLESRNYAGVGEVGIDLYWDKTFASEQSEAFVYQIELAKEHNLPVIIHSRDALDLTIKTISEQQNGNLRGIFHCFNGTVDQGKEIIDIGFLMGIGGVVTFKNAGVDKTVAELPLEHMVLETDAPYLSPTPYRGKRNTPTYIPIIAKKLSEIMDRDTTEIAKITSDNCKALFKY